MNGVEGNDPEQERQRDNDPKALERATPPRSSDRGQGRTPVAGALTSDLLRGVPWVVWSFLLVSGVVSLFFGLDSYPYWLPVGAWLVSGAMMWWPRAELTVVRRLYRLRRPNAAEAQQLGPVWRHVVARAGVEPSALIVWVTRSGSVAGGGMVTAPATVGRVVGVTEWALYTLPPANLEAVLAHELAHHLNGRGRLNLVLLWYSLPARGVAAAGRRLFGLLRKSPQAGCVVIGFIAACMVGVLLTSAILGSASSFVTWLLVWASPFVAPLVFRLLERREEWRADRIAAQLGYGPVLLQTLQGWQALEIQQAGQAFQVKRSGRTDSLAISDRIDALEQHLAGAGLGRGGASWR